MSVTTALRPAFFDLPPEIREQVYGGVLSDPSGAGGLQMLRTSQQVYAEAQPLLYKRPATFASQFDLYDWVHASSAQNLRHVQCVRVKLLDAIAHDGLPDASIRRRPPNHRRASPSPIARAYEADAQRFATALQQLPGARSLTLYKNRCADVAGPFQDVHAQLFAGVARQLPHLHSLTFYADHVALDFLPALRQLQRLRFTGFSASPPKDALRALQQLERLEALELFGPPPTLEFQQRAGYSGPPSVRSVTPEVVKALRPLSSFTICEICDPYASNSAVAAGAASGNDADADADADAVADTGGGVFVTKAMLAALAQTHASSLRSLRLSTDLVLPADCVAALAALLAACTTLHELELGWPALEGSALLDALPPSLRRLHINVGVAAGAGLRPTELADRLVARRACVPALAEVVLRTDWRDAGAKEQAGCVGAAIARLRTVGIAASKCSWYPIILDNLD
jgi:hypothetical protein